MATKTTVELTDDLDGKSKAVETIELSLDGITYQIDLTEKNAAKLRKDFEPFIASARRTGGRKGRALSVVETGVDTRAVRAWAESNGYEVSSRGRISAEILQAYRAAGN